MFLTQPSLHKPSRIISLVPSITELLHILGLNDQVIAITKFCVHPNEWYKTKLRIGGTKNLDIGAITALEPDLIIATKEENIRADVEALAEKFPVVLTDVHDVASALKMIRTVGEYTHAAEAAYSLAEKIAKEFRSMTDLPKIKVAYLIWREPYMTAGGDTFVSSMMHAAGFENIFEDESRYPKIEISDLQKRSPQLVFLSSEPYPFREKHIAEPAQHLPGVRIELVDGEMFSWYGSRMQLAPKYFLSLRRRLNL